MSNALRVLFTVLALCAAIPLAAQLSLKPFPLRTDDGEVIAAEAGTLVVPSRHGVPDSPPLELAVLRLRATSPSGGAPIVYLAGGPGNSATNYAMYPPLLALRSVGDVILLDQRGTGRSKPAPRCRASQPLDPEVVYADEKRTTAGAIEMIRECVADWRAAGFEVDAFNTNEAADDLEALRTALGVPKLRLVGFSYGTHLALAALRRHGAHLERVVLIGTEGPDDTWKLPHTFDAQLMKLSYLATGTDVMVRALEKVMRRLEKAPVIVSITLEDGGDPVDVTVSRFGLERILLDDLGDSNDFVLFPAMITMLEEGDVSLLARYVEKRFRGMRRGIPLMSLATDCASGASPERLMTIAKQRVTSMFPRTNYPYPAICSAVGATDLSEEFRSPVRTTVPTLFISGSLDAQTPPFQAERERWSFTKSAHIVVVNAGHEDLDNNLDVIAAIIRFLRGENVASATIDAPRPKFVSVEELKRRMNE